MAKPRHGTSGAGRDALPAERAFVVQLRADADLAHGIVRGRVEHVVSGAAGAFDSVEQLLDRMHDVVGERPRRGQDTL